MQQYFENTNCKSHEINDLKIFKEVQGKKTAGTTCGVFTPDIEDILN